MNKGAISTHSKVTWSLRIIAWRPLRFPLPLQQCRSARVTGQAASTRVPAVEFLYPFTPKPVGWSTDASGRRQRLHVVSSAPVRQIAGLGRDITCPAGCAGVDITGLHCGRIGRVFLVVFGVGIHLGSQQLGARHGKGPSLLGLEGTPQLQRF